MHMIDRNLIFYFVNEAYLNVIDWLLRIDIKQTLLAQSCNLHENEYQTAINRNK